VPSREIIAVSFVTLVCVAMVGCVGESLLPDDGTSVARESAEEIRQTPAEQPPPVIERPPHDPTAGKPTWGFSDDLIVLDQRSAGLFEMADAEMIAGQVDLLALNDRGELVVRRADALRAMGPAFELRPLPPRGQIVTLVDVAPQKDSWLGGPLELIVQDEWVEHRRRMLAQAEDAAGPPAPEPIVIWYWPRTSRGIIFDDMQWHPDPTSPGSDYRPAHGAHVPKWSETPVPPGLLELPEELVGESVETLQSLMLAAEGPIDADVLRAAYHRQALTGHEEVVVQSAVSSNRELRNVAREILFHNGEDGSVAAAIAIALRCDLCPAHLAWLISRIEKGHRYSPHFLSGFLNHEHPHVRAAALMAMARVSNDRDQCLDRLLLMADIDPAFEVRYAALVQTRDLCEPGSKEHEAVSLAIDSLAKVQLNRQMSEEIVDVLAQLLAQQEQLNADTREARKASVFGLEEIDEDLRLRDARLEDWMSD